LDIRKNYLMFNITSNSAPSVRYRRFQYQAQFDMAYHVYQTQIPPMGKGYMATFNISIYIYM
jgi:hypothetical protein